MNLMNNETCKVNSSIARHVDWITNMADWSYSNVNSICYIVYDLRVAYPDIFILDC